MVKTPQSGYLVPRPGRGILKKIVHVSRSKREAGGSKQTHRHPHPQAVFAGSDLSLPFSPPFSGYLHPWSLHRSPFLGCPDFFFSGQAQREAIAGLTYFAGSDWKLAFLVAPRCSGVSRLLDHVVSMQGLGTCPVDVILSRSDHKSPDSLLQQLGSLLGYGPHSLPTPQTIDRAIQQSDKQGIRTLWFLEDYPASAIGMAADLAQRHRNFSVVATTEPDQRDRLHLHAGVCGMRIDLDPLTLEDTASYVHTALKQAGASEAIFSDTAITYLHEGTSGLIGEIAVIAESALAAAACSGLTRITPNLIQMIVETHGMRSAERSATRNPHAVLRAA